MPDQSPDKLTKLREYHALVKQVMSIAEKETIEEVAVSKSSASKFLGVLEADLLSSMASRWGTAHRRQASM